MAQQTVWGYLVERVGVRQARRIATFVECWSVSHATWESPPTSEVLQNDWGFTDGEVSYWIEQYRNAFRPEQDPSRLVEVIAAEHGYVGIQQLRTTPLQRLLG